MQGRFLFFALPFLLSFLAQSQEIKVRGGFMQDEFEIGEDVTFWMTASYPERTELLMPDSLFDFTPFEYAGKNYFSSKLSRSGIIFDSAVYHLQCYEIDDLQYLKLPAIALAFGDSTFIYTPADSIFFKQLVAQVSDTTALKTNLSYAKVSRQFNFPLLWIILGVVAIIAIIVFLVFGKKIMTKVKLKRLKKNYIKFSDAFTVLIRDVKQNPDRQHAEKAVTFWKKYEEKLDRQPFSKMTTKEVLALGFTQELNESLREIDRLVYGRDQNPEIFKAFQGLEDFTQHRYKVKEAELRNGK